ncbi:similar to Saccharomyces cerevisiae YGL251C HFM1 Meiosis specific DNA helicase involved in the conversion of double-stranded breaks to later recombination intermediates and in crossover control [Maudiozyma saulgeensis]|uniref:Similar to Saccharomyces cerevisiae YGL251C HFM1 Meiosis specific DNA helicase involved in the conversion of double-stranded breaks to later recombination intermediates and in crossover control n=1 Tax=Maudiozyma saulgeensis TaxID=1789683 RepID=A0A1X7QX57_9SACH|nr:similar to Saccharomyces cerevisiae YGL251C HFM1 Meiosis specific DNA helicase involved in the conversion of double-stranded breaks to later recombination intermediates and in crossover control [Kazachstania saulgeensis]
MSNLPHKKKLKVRKIFHDQEEEQLQQKLIPVACIDSVPQTFFPFEFFNKMQSESFEKVFKTNENCIISAPTGSGKTVLFELAILRYISNFSESIENKKILYISPTKSLCSEITNKWKNKFNNLAVVAITGDSTSYEINSVKKSQLIITTPEKWDLLTRKWTDYHKLFELIQLVLVDEIHTIGEIRGATLEAVLTRMNTLCQGIRIIGVSATIPNITDIASWLKNNKSGEFATVLKFDDTYRQVKLDVTVKGYNFNCKNEFQRDAIYNQKLLELIEQYSKNRPVLIFCPTRASTMNTAKYISNNNSANGKVTATLADKTLHFCMTKGVAFHNAGLILEDRSLVEEAFLNGVIRILCATSTLAVGVNLPAYLVIIKGTQMWSLSEMVEYSNLDTLQMIGRAGRPKFEKTGCAIIMTEQKMVSKYENLVSGSDILESKLHLQLREHMCSEVSLGTINSVKSAITWIKSTFFYVRFLKNRIAYDSIGRLGGFDAEESLEQFCQKLLNSLNENNLIVRDGEQICCNAFGHAMVRHYISFGTISNILKGKKFLNTQEVLSIVVQAEEFKDLRIRQNEKRLYKEINLSPLTRYPFLTLKKQSMIIDKTNQKVSLIIQYDLGGLEFPNYEGAQKLHHVLIQDKIRIFKHCYRILRCMVDCYIEKGDGISLENSLFMLRSINGSCWEDSPMILRQIKSIGLVSVRKLVRNGITDFEELRNSTDQKLEYYLGLKMGNGLKLRRDIESLPTFRLEYHIEKQAKVGNNIEVVLRVDVSVNCKSSLWHGKRLSMNINSRYGSGKIIDFRRIQLSQLQHPKTFKLNCTISSLQELVKISASCQEIAGLNKIIQFSSKELSDSNTQVFEKVAMDLSSSKSRISVLDDIVSSSSDESLYNLLIDRPSRNASASIASSRKDEPHSNVLFEGRQQLPNGNYECQHTCNRKGECRHLCCHEGIPKELIRGRRTNTRHMATEKPDVPIKEKTTPLLQGVRKTTIRQNSDIEEYCISSYDECGKGVEDESHDFENYFNSPALSDSCKGEENILDSKVLLENSLLNKTLEPKKDIFDSSLAKECDDCSINLSFLGSDIELGE